MSSIRALLRSLNRERHFHALVVYLIVLALHMLEHAAQSAEIYALKMEPAESLGFLGLAFPVLVSSELLHFGHAVFTIGGLILLLPAVKGTARRWWVVALVIQSWHQLEHTALLLQVWVGENLFDRDVPTSFAQFIVPRVELHLIYNLSVLIPLLIAVSLHWFPAGTGQPDGPEPTCTCAARLAVASSGPTSDGQTARAASARDA